MKCDQARALIGSATDNELANAEAALVADHISDCAPCRDQWDKILEVREGIRDIRRAQEPDGDFEKRLLIKVYREQRKKSQVAFNLAVGLAASALIAIGAVSYFKTANQATVSVENLVAAVGHHYICRSR